MEVAEEKLPVSPYKLSMEAHNLWYYKESKSALQQ
jgi:hypothetical protein